MASAPTQSPILPCVDHALPYQVYFEEHRARRSKDLLFATLEALPEFSPALFKHTRWDDLKKERNAALRNLDERRKQLSDVEQQKLGEIDSDVQAQLERLAKAQDQRKEVSELETTCRTYDDEIWEKFNGPLVEPREAIQAMEAGLETLWRQLTGLRILLADLNTKAFKGIDLTALFDDLDKKKAHVERQRDTLRKELAQRRLDCERIELQLWLPLTRQVNLVIAAYSRLKQSKAEPSKLLLPFESLEEFEFRERERQKAIVDIELQCKREEEPLRRILHQMNGTALCLSGGGIRSASFSLGVLQGLSRFSLGRSWGQPPTDTVHSDLKPPDNSLMAKLDYLSTVSGGGYIGSWLIAWARRVTYSNVIAQLGTPAITSGDPEHRPVRHLREFTSYLAPKYGFSLDSLTLAAIVMRNMFLNWLMLVPAVVALLCLPQFVLYWSYRVTDLGTAKGRGPLYFWVAMATACALIGIAAWFAAKHMAFPRELGLRVTSTAKAIAAPRSVKLFALLLFISAWVLGEIWLLSQVLSQALKHESPEPRGYLLVLWLLSSIPPLMVSWYRARNALSGRNALFNRAPASGTDHTSGQVKRLRLMGSYIAPFAAGSVAMLLLWGVGEVFAHHLFRPDEGISEPVRDVSILAIVPAVLWVLMMASAVLSGLLSNIEREEEREWWSRAGALLMALALGWLGLCAIAYFGYEVLRWGMSAALAAVGLSTGFLGSLGGLSAATASDLKRVNREQLTRAQRFLADHDLFIPAVCSAALLCLAVLLGAFTFWLRRVVEDITADHASLSTSYPTVQFAYQHSTFCVFVAALLLAAVANFFINVNTFSLHGMYRMRLTRAYLGASNLSRQPNPFTNFDPTDNLWEGYLPADGSAPLHIINAALNVVATRNLAWQQRKAEPFSFSPLHCGCWRIGYARTRQYGGYRGVRLGTAMAISGAAVNPNMGYHSSALVTLLMTFFNTRLGWWLPNPGLPRIAQNRIDEIIASPSSAPTTQNAINEAIDFLQQAGPTFGLAPLIAEALGKTDDNSRFIQLSDGGHFENLGLYEMVMRRCRTIIVVDGDADSKYEFDDLGNAVRKIYIDLGIPIHFTDFPAGLPMKRGKDGVCDPSSLYCFSGKINYSCIDSEAEDGVLIIIKPVLNGSEPEDVRAYALTHPAFPHESTANQFFNEAQFESYRHLGSWVMDKIMGEPADSTQNTMQRFVELAKQYSSKRAAAAE